MSCLFNADLFPSFNEENPRYQVSLYPRRVPHYNTTRPVPAPNGDEAHYRHQDFDAVRDGIAALGLEVVAGPVRIPRSSGLSSRRYYLTRRGSSNPAVDSDVDTSTESLAIVSGRLNYGPFLDSLLSSGEVEDWHTTSQPVSPALPVDDPANNTERAPSPEFRVEINDTITSFVSHLSDGSNSLDCTANRGDVTEDDKANDNDNIGLDTTREASFTAPPTPPSISRAREIIPEIPQHLLDELPGQPETEDLGPVSDVDVEGAKALLTSATNPSSPPTVIRHTSLEPFRRTLSQHTVDSHTVLVESLQAYKRQLSSVTTISNDSNTSMASLTNRSAEMEVFDGDDDTSKSRRPAAKKKHL